MAKAFCGGPFSEQWNNWTSLEVRIVKVFQKLSEQARFLMSTCNMQHKHTGRQWKFIRTGILANTSKSKHT